MPSKGPWFESGIKTIGPTKPKMKPIAPIIIPPIITCNAKLFDVDDFFVHTKTLIIIAINNEIILGSKTVA